MFRADQIVVRVAPSELTPLHAAVAAGRLAYWLNERDLCVAQPAGTSGDVQSVDGSTVSLWRWEKACAAKVPAAVHGALVRDLHALLDHYEDALPHTTCLSALEARLRFAGAHPHLSPEARDLHRSFERLAAQLHSVAPALAPGPIHCDPHGGNLLRTSHGWLVLDLDGVAFGYREWDWSSGARAHRDGERRSFVDGYGEGDIEQWPGYESLLALKLLDTLAWTAIHDAATNGTGESVARALADFRAASRTV